ncbi:hypothetical protein CEV32_4847 [Brucella rhizosphaerae]|uniref:Uncharacterized protein n=1 Tax=Brucella rhizosphaerae TaxID=571254 RepID=A0A256FM96_9HYPH|nr:hypothetical protein CEV32_4847 [Brucella rhizosphaerae]
MDFILRSINAGHSKSEWESILIKNYLTGRNVIDAMRKGTT